MAATGAEIASAYVSITTKFPGAQTQINKALGGLDVSKSGTAIGTKLTNTLKKSMKVGAVAIGGVMAAGIGTALVKGLSRLNSIDQATAKLRGLGNSAGDVDKIMSNALASVKGTAFGLDAAATTAAGAIAAGIKPGSELEGVLKSVANAAAAAGTPMEEMGSIYNKVASLGKAQNDSLQQVADRGIPIYQKLGEQLGVTTDEVFKMASAGKIGFSDFETAMTAAAGTVASEMGGTVSGSWDNFMSSLGRAGAGVMGGVWSSLAPVLQAATNAMGPLEVVAASVGEKIGKFLAPAIEWLVDSLNNGVDFSMFSPIGVIFEALKPVLPIVSKAIAEIAALFGDVLAAVLPPLMPVLTDLLGVFSDLAAQVLPPLMSIFKALSPVIQLIGTVVGALAPIITPLVTLALMPLMMILKPLTPLFELLGKVIEPVATVVANVLTPILNTLTDVMGSVAGKVTTVSQDFIPKIGEAFTNVWAVLKPVFDVIKFAFAILAGVIVGIWDVIIKPMLDAFAAVVTWLYASVIQPVFGFIGAAIKLVWETVIKPVFDTIWGVITNTLGPVFSWLYNTIIKPVWDSIKNTIKGVWENGIKPVIDTLVKVIQSDPKKAFEAARDAIGKAWEGIQDLAKKPVKFVIETVINGLIGTINKIPGVNIPKVPLPKGFARGGILPGMSRMGDGDDQMIMARRGEGMMVSEALRTSADRSAFLAANAAGRSGVGFASMLQGFARGGLVNPLPQGSYSVSQQWGNAGHNGIDLAAPQGTKVFAAADGVVGLAGVVPMGGNEVYIQHANGLGTRYSHLSSFATQAGANVKAGNVIGRVGSTGNSTGPHLHYMVHNPGLGAGSYYPNQNPAPYMGIFGKDLGDAGGASSILDGLVDWAASKIKGAFPDGGMWVDVAAGMAKDAAGKMAKAFNPFAASDVGTTLYDNGGLLQPGISLVENKTGRPEPILTGAQWDAMKNNSSNGGTVRVFIGDREFEGWMDERADDAVDRGFDDMAAAGRLSR